MTDRKNVSGISDHKKRKGALVAPLNAGLGEKLKFSSWTKERMPEYLWLGLILKYYGRKLGLEKAGNILFEISRSGISLPAPRLSMIFDLSDDDQKTIYKIILRHVEEDVLTPLTLVYRRKLQPLFNEYFFISHMTVEERIQTLSEAVKVYSPHQSHEATDLRFLSLCLLLFNGKIVVSTEAKATIEALKKYPYTEHDDENMRWYRPAIRSTEIGMTLDEYNTEFSYKFWREFGMITPCNPIRIDFPENTTDYKEFIADCRKALEYVFYSNKEKSLMDDKFDVIMGSTNYGLKIFAEIGDKALGNSILGRHGIRTIIEVYIMLKYLLKREADQPKIWEEYKLYGISKYKLVLLKARESNNLDESSHFPHYVVEALVNEIRWEEFIDVDLNYFDKQGIRDKSIDVGEKDLYDFYYDYDSSFAHGLWGAVRESSMLHCNSADHQFHAVPDIYDNQNLPD
ncbi:MAG: hypothetical protein EHJ95_08220, partial [Methanobacteriota archaeon]